MEDSVKTTALKKAYAKIILNTAQESAARVMISDRNSARFRHDLCETKEEALRLLVRLKQMIDAKTIEAEITSSNKQRKIDVLEAQLQEAEDIITELRSELRWVRDKLEKAKVFNESNVVNKEEETVYAQNDGRELLAVGSLDPNQSSLHDDECGNVEKRFDGFSVDISKGFDACESELEVSVSNKKLELSRNGCTQRIHALERKVLEEKCITEKDSELSSREVNVVETGVSGNTRCLVLALRSRNAEVITIPTNGLGIKRSSKLRGRRKRSWGKRKATSVRSQSQLLKHCHSLSVLCCSKTSMENSDGEDSMETHQSVESEVVGTLNACKELEDHLQHNIGIIRDGKRSKNMASCNLVSINVEDDENKTEIKPLPRLDPGLTSFKTNVVTTSGSTNVTVSSVNATNRSADKDLELRKEDSLVSSTKMGSELVNLHSESEVTAVVSDQISESPRADRNRLVMYTFQRKRKKGSLNEACSSKYNSTGKREVEEKENNAQDLIESTLTNETPVLS